MAKLLNFKKFSCTHVILVVILLLFLLKKAESYGSAPAKKYSTYSPVIEAAGESAVSCAYDGYGKCSDDDYPNRIDYGWYVGNSWISSDKKCCKRCPSGKEYKMGNKDGKQMLRKTSSTAICTPTAISTGSTSSGGTLGTVGTLGTGSTSSGGTLVQLES